MKTKAIIFDLDGVITDTERFHYLSWKRVALKAGLHLTEEEHNKLKGRSREDCLELILEMNEVVQGFDDAEKEQLCEGKNRIYLEFIDSLTEKDILPGIKEFILQSKAEGYKLAVASVSKNAHRVLSSLGLAELFDYIADIREVKNPKPDPEIFSICARELGVKPEYCVGIEDSQAGIEAIRRAGMRSVGIGVKVVTVKPDIELSSTAELTLDSMNI